MLLNQDKNWKSEFSLFEQCWKQRVRGPGRPWAPGLRAAPRIAPSAVASPWLWFFLTQLCPSVWHIQLWLCNVDNRGFPGGAVVKNLHVNAGDERDVGLNPGSRRSPGVGNGKRLQYSCLENPMVRGTWWAIVHGVARSRT